MLEETRVRLFDQHPTEQRHPAPDMILDELLLGIDDDLGFFRAVMAARVGFFVGQEVHELEFDTQMIEPLVDIFGEFDTERLIEAGDVAHDVGLRKDVIVTEQRFVGRTVERNDVAEHAPVFGLQFAQLPVHALGGDQFFDLVELLAHQCQLLLGPIPSDPVECRLQGIEGRAPVFHEFAALQVVEKFVVFGVEQAPRNQKVQLTAVECTFDCGGIFDAGDSE